MTALVGVLVACCVLSSSAYSAPLQGASPSPKKAIHEKRIANVAGGEGVTTASKGDDFIDSPEALPFRQVFGSDRLRTHFSSASDLEMSVSRARRPLRSLVSDEDVLSNSLICGEYSRGPALKKQLQEMNGIQTVSTAFASQMEETTCFAITSTREAVEFVTSKLHSVTVKSVPNSLKIHQSVMYSVGLHRDSHGDAMRSSTALSPESLATHHRLLRTYDFDLDLSSVALVASSNGKRSQELSYSNHASRLRRALNSRDHTEMSLDMLSGDYGHGEHNAWTRVKKMAASTTMSSKGHKEETHFNCVDAFEKLEVSQSSNRVFIRNLNAIEEFSVSYVATAAEGIEMTSSKHLQTMCFAQLLSVLATDPETIDIRFKHPQRKLNHLIKGIAQANRREQYYPYLSRGLDATGQVVGVADTGLDEYSCFFSNDDGSLVARSSYTSPTFDNSKRKVIQYIDYRDGTDEMEGHGTHCCGSVAGYSSIDVYTNHSGHATNAKLAFFDMQDSDGFGFYIPMEDMLNCAYVAGAKLSSNSYGGMSNEYDADSIGVDEFSNQHDDYLALFAAGNEGSEGYYSLSGCSIAKNAVGVGASESLDDSNSDIGNIAFFSSIGPTFDERIKPDVVAPGYMTYSAMSSGTDAETCEIVDMAGTSMATPATAGIAAQIRQYFEDSAFWATICSESMSNLVMESSLCLAGAFSPRGATVKALLVHSGEPMARYHSPPAYCYGYEDDLVDGCESCNGEEDMDCVTCKSGYEIDVVYADCSGLCVPEGTSTQLPSDSVCEPTDSWSNDDAPEYTKEPIGELSAGPPDMYQGFGRVSLPNILPLSGVQEDIQLYVNEMELLPMTEMSTVLKINLTASSAPFKVTICWMDPTNEVFSAKLLLHDIDLIVERLDDGMKWYGNKKPGDERNNVEQVSINSKGEGLYKVMVVSKMFTESDSQKVSLIVTAPTLEYTEPFSSRAISYDYLSNEMNCSAGETMITVRLLDNGGDGWDAGDRFDIIRTSDDFVMWSRTLDGNVTRDSNTREALCLPNGDYSAVMIQSGDDSDEMGVEIDDCFIHLSDSSASASLVVENGECNTCAGMVVTLSLTGSPFSIPYGWKDNTRYMLTNSDDVNTYGSLVMGIEMDHRLCLPNGEYHLRFDSVADSDDWIDDESYYYSMKDDLGIGEYLITVSNVNTSTAHSVEIDVTGVMTIRVFDDRVEVTEGEEPFTSAPTSVPSLAPSTSAPSSRPSSLPTSYPSGAPSAAPSASMSPTTATSMPTRSPVASRTVVSFSSNMEMMGISASSFDAPAKEAFAEVTASGIDGVEADGITDIVATDIIDSSRSKMGSHVFAVESSVSFRVTAVEEEMPEVYSDTLDLVSAIEDDMVELFANESTSDLFVQLSVSKGSSMPPDTEITFDAPVANTSSVSSSVVSTHSPTAAVVSSGSGGSDGGLSERDTIIVIVVVVVVLLVTIGIVYVAFFSAKESPLDASKTAPPAEGTSNPMNKDREAPADQL